MEPSVNYLKYYYSLLNVDVSSNYYFFKISQEQRVYLQSRKGVAMNCFWLLLFWGEKTMPNLHHFLNLLPLSWGPFMTESFRHQAICRCGDEALFVSVSFCAPLLVAWQGEWIYSGRVHDMLSSLLRWVQTAPFGKYMKFLRATEGVLGRLSQQFWCSLKVGKLAFVFS